MTEETEENIGAVGRDETRNTEFATEQNQQLNPDHLAEIWGIRSTEAKLREVQQKKEVTKITLDMINDSLRGILERKRKPELERTVSRITDRIKALREHNTELESLMIQAGNPFPDVAVFNYRNELELDVFLDMQLEVEEVLKSLEPLSK